MRRRLRVAESLTGPYSDTSGASAVEFAMILPVMLLLTLGIFEFGRYFWTQNTLQYAAEQTARYAMVHPHTCNSDTMTTLLTDPTRLIGLSATSVTVAAGSVSNTDATQPTGGWTTSNPQPKACQIDVTYSFTFLAVLPALVNGASWGAITVHGLSEYPCQSDNSDCPSS